MSDSLTANTTTTDPPETPEHSESPVSTESVSASAVDTPAHLNPPPTPKRPPPSPELPPTPKKARRSNVTPLTIPVPLVTHRGKGLTLELAPQTESQTRADYRRYLLKSLCDWLLVTAAPQAREIDVFGGLETLRAVEYLSAGTWPAMRLWYIAETLEEEILDPVERTAVAALRVGEWLLSRNREWPVAEGFLKVDRLTDGRTLWDLMEEARSPFEALREAPALSDADSEDDEDEEPVSFWETRMTVSFTLFELIMGLVAIVTYLWFVAGVISILGHK